jgi:probable F420-dependent oxidoreductase
MALLAAVAGSSTAMGLGIGVIPAPVRSPPLLAMGAAALEGLVGDRGVMLGVGVSSPVVVEQWHGREYPRQQLGWMREYLTVLRMCLSGKRVSFHGEHFDISGFKLTVPMDSDNVKIVVGALNPGMLAVAGELADGVLLNYMPVDRVAESVRVVKANGDASVYCYIHAGIDPDAKVLEDARRDLAGYCMAPGYVRHFGAAGFGRCVEAVRRGFEAGKRDEAYGAVSDEMLQSIKILGDARHVSSAVERYMLAGVEEPILFPLVGSGGAGDVLSTWTALADS